MAKQSNNSNAQKVSAIKKINKEIDTFTTLKNEILSSRSKFAKAFPNYSHTGDEIKMITEKIQSLQAEIQEISSTIDKGTLLSEVDVSQAVLDAWGRTKIKKTVINLTPEDEDLEYIQDIFIEGCGLKFEANELQKIEYYYDAKSRNDLWLVRVFLAPGFSYASLDTGKVGWFVDVTENSKFLGALAANIDE